MIAADTFSDSETCPVLRRYRKNEPLWRRLIAAGFDNLLRQECRVGVHCLMITWHGDKSEIAQAV